MCAMHKRIRATRGRKPTHARASTKFSSFFAFAPTNAKHVSNQKQNVFDRVSVRTTPSEKHQQAAASAHPHAYAHACSTLPRLRSCSDTAAAKRSVFRQRRATAYEKTYTYNNKICCWSPGEQRGVFPAVWSRFPDTQYAFSVIAKKLPTAC